MTKTLRLIAICLLMPGGLVLQTGCTYKWQVTKTQPRFNKLKLTYELDHPQQALTPEIELVDGLQDLDQTESFDLMGKQWASAALKVEYPHPQHRDGMTKVSLRLGHVSRRSQGLGADENPVWLRWPFGRERLPDQPPLKIGSFPQDEVWVLDVPKHEIEEMIAALDKAGYFQRQSRPQGGTQLAVKIGWHKLDKAWTTEPALDGMMSRVYREGSFEGFCSSLDGDFPDEPTVGIQRLIHR